MKKIFVASLLWISVTSAFAQSHGLTYQAIIIDNNAQEIPGLDIRGNVIPNQSLTVRFTILSSTGAIDYQEIQPTQTDKYGMINLTIGKGVPTADSPGPFEEIGWDGTKKDLKVEISTGESTSTFVEFGNQELYFVPYAFHRNITATGTLIIDGATTLKSSLDVTNGSATHLSGTLMVDGATTLNSTFDVTNGSATHLSGTAMVDGATTLNSSLDVTNGSATHLSGTLMVDLATTLNSSLDVTNGSATHLSGTAMVDLATTLNSSLDVTNGSATHLSGTAMVDLATTLNSSLDVTNGSATHLSGTLMVDLATTLNGQVTIASGVNGVENLYGSYPLRIEGSNQGIAVRINGSRDNSNNFISFWDGTGMQGRVEGQTSADVLNDPGYIFDNSLYTASTIVQAVNLVTAGAAAVLDPGNLIIETANSIALAAEIVAYNVFAFQDLGVTFESGAGDYAEWLPRLHPEERMEAGQVVGVFGGRVTKVTNGAEQIMVISSAPIILGNMTPGGLSEGDCEKIGFIGQVPVWVYGPVHKGDYIVAYQSGSGLGKAVSAEELTLDMMDKIVGRAWAGSETMGINLINTVIGLKTNEMVHVIRSHQAKIHAMELEIASLKKQQDADRRLLMRLVPGYTEGLENQHASDQNQATEKVKETLAVKPDATISSKPFSNGTRINRAQILEAFRKVEQAMVDQGIKTETIPMLQKIKNDPKYLDEVVDGVMKAFERISR